jgi:hypothetical protein
MNTTTRHRSDRRQPVATPARRCDPWAGTRTVGRVVRAVQPHPRGTRDPRTARGRLR